MKFIFCHECRTLASPRKSSRVTKHKRSQGWAYCACRQSAVGYIDPGLAVGMPSNTIAVRGPCTILALDDKFLDAAGAQRMENCLVVSRTAKSVVDLDDSSVPTTATVEAAAHA